MNRFFRILWRINAFIIFLAGLGGLVAVGIIFFSLVASRWPVSTSVRILDPSEEPAKVEWSISQIQHLDGTDIVRSRLTTSGDYGASFSSGPYYPTWNFLYYDTQTDDTWFLLPTHTSLIVENEDYCFPTQPVESRKTLWSSFAIADKDTNNDKKTTRQDKLSFAASQADGKRFTVLLSDIDDVLETTLVGQSELLAFYKKDDKYFVCRIDLTKMEVVSTRDLSALKPQ